MGILRCSARQPGSNSNQSAARASRHAPGFLCGQLVGHPRRRVASRADYSLSKLVRDPDVRGQVYVYQHDGTTWRSSGTILRPDDPRLCFAYSVDFDGARAIVGSIARIEDSTYNGVAHVYDYLGNGEWGPPTALGAADVRTAGWDVAISDDWAVVSATGTACVLMYRRSENGWSLAQTLKSPSRDAVDSRMPSRSRAMSSPFPQDRTPQIRQKAGLFTCTAWRQASGSIAADSPPMSRESTIGLALRSLWKAACLS